MSNLNSDSDSNITTLKKLAIISDFYIFKADMTALAEKDIQTLLETPATIEGKYNLRVYHIDNTIYIEKTESNINKILQAAYQKAVPSKISHPGMIDLFTKFYKLTKYENTLISCDGNIFNIQLTDSLAIRPFIVNKDFIRYIRSRKTGIILINENNAVLNLHLNIIARELRLKLDIGRTTEEKIDLLEGKGLSVITNFDYEDDYETIADLLSQNKLIIVMLNKYSNERLINAFTSRIPIYLKTNLINNLLSTYTYFEIKSQNTIRHTFVAGMYNLKADILQDNFSEKSIQMANQLFNTEVKMSSHTNVEVEDLPPEDYIRTIISKAKELGASDISLSVGSVPLVRVRDQLIPIEVGTKEEDKTILSVKLGPNTMAKFTDTILTTKKQKDALNESNQVDTAYSLTGNKEGSGRFRVAIYRQRNSLAISMRILKSMQDKGSQDRALSARECGVPQHVIDIISTTKKGLILFTGPVNTGKSTIMNSLIDYLNSGFYKKIITIEDPIETLHNSKTCLIEQREVGIDCDSYEDGLKQALRSDPNVVNVGEIRTKLAAETALAAARSGHLVMSTLHTPDATQTVNTILQFFKAEERQNIKNILRDELVMTYSQQLLPNKSKTGLVPAQEILLNNTAFKGELKKDDFNFQNIIINNAKEGMISMDKSIASLYSKGLITEQTALFSAHNQDTLKQFIEEQTMRR